EATGNRMNSTSATNKPFNIEKRLVYEAYKAVKSNKGAAGVDKQTIEQFEKDLSGNLYKICNEFPNQLAVWRIYSSSQSIGYEDHAGDDSGLALVPADTPVLAGPSLRGQSSPQGMDCILWALYSVGTVSLPSIRQSDARGVGGAEVQALQPQ